MLLNWLLCVILRERSTSYHFCLITNEYVFFFRDNLVVIMENEEFEPCIILLKKKTPQDSISYTTRLLSQQWDSILVFVLVILLLN